jgi:hypothetical protein
VEGLTTVYQLGISNRGMRMSRYTPEYWRNRADEVRAIRDNMTSEESRRILAEIAADYDRLRDLALKEESGPMRRQQAVDVLMSTPFSAATRGRKAKE